MAEVKFSEFPQSPDVADPDEVVGLKDGLNQRFPSSLFKGDPGDPGTPGTDGSDGSDGTNATATAGTTTTLLPGADATVVNSGTVNDAVFDFGIPEGEKGTPGDPGAPGSNGTNATADAGTTTTGAPGTNASVTNVGTVNDAVFDFIIPRGDKGEQGDAGSGYDLQGDATVAELNALTAASITTNFAWVMLDGGTVNPTGALQGTAVAAGDLVVWAEADYFVNYGQTSGAVVDSVFGRTGAVIAEAGDYNAFYYTEAESDARYATTAQGVLADAAIQPGDDITELNNNAGYKAYYSVTGGVPPDPAGYAEGDLIMVLP